VRQEGSRGFPLQPLAQPVRLGEVEEVGDGVLQARPQGAIVEARPLLDPRRPAGRLASSAALPRLSENPASV
jgi:hypothetical protein